MHKSWTVALVVSSIFFLNPMQAHAQSLREFDISRSDFMRPDPQEYSAPPPKPKSDVELEGPIPISPPNPKKRKALLLTSAGIGFAGLGLEVGALVTVIVAYGANLWFLISEPFTCGYHRHMDEDGGESIVENECPEETAAAENDLNRRLGIAGKISIAGGATLGAAGIFAFSTILATGHSQPRSSAKAPHKLVSQLRPTLSLDSNSFQVGFALAL